MAFTRRQFLRNAGAAGAALTVHHPLRAMAGPLFTAQGQETDRSSRLNTGTWLAHADLHNHSHLSDGTGHHAQFFPSVKNHGLDVAALTDHSTLSWGGFSNLDACGTPVFATPESGDRHECRQVGGLTEAGWQITQALADAMDDPGSFVALGAFEWSSPFLGHVNVWFSKRWIDPLHTAGIGPEGIGAHVHAFPELGPEVLQPLLDEATRRSPLRGTGMAPFYEWLQLDPDTPYIGGGADGIASFNHPGREEGRFSFFRYEPGVADQMVVMEILNRQEDYLFKRYTQGQHSPLVECLNEGWRVGLTGVTDEHGTNWGEYQGKGRTGLWLRDDLGLTREGVREALEARRVYATREQGLRLDATANGVQMGNAIAHPDGVGTVAFEVDVDAGPASWGHDIEIQVLRPDEAFPRVAYEIPAKIPENGTIKFDAELDSGEGDWVVLRIADPNAPNPHPGPPEHRCSQTFALAYASPFWLEPA